MAQPFGPAPSTTPDALEHTASAWPPSGPQQVPAPHDIDGPTTAGLSLLAAPAPQLSGDGQLRELIEERRTRFGEHAHLWYLPPAGVGALALGNHEEEAVVASDPGVITWLQLRFGGRVGTVRLGPAELQTYGAALPSPAPQASVAWG